jgi:hypothetical protein
MRPDLLFEASDIIVDDIHEVESVVAESLHTSGQGEEPEK